MSKNNIIKIKILAISDAFRFQTFAFLILMSLGSSIYPFMMSTENDQ